MRFGNGPGKWAQRVDPGTSIGTVPVFLDNGFVVQQKKQEMQL
jgi:hypothetical protein